MAATTIFLPKSVEVTHESRESVTPSTSSSISWPEDLRPRRVKEKRKRIEETKKNSLVVESSDEGRSRQMILKFRIKYASLNY